MLHHRPLDPSNPADTQADAAVQDAQDEVTFGGRFALPAESRAEWWASNRYYARDVLGVFDDDRLVAVAEAFLALTENTDTIEIEFSVTPEFARRCRDNTEPTALSALCAAAEDLCHRAGRSQLEVWARLPHEDENPSDLLPYPVVAELGLTRQVTEIAAVLELPADPARLAALADEATDRMTAGGYRLISWCGAMPPEYLDSYGRLMHQLIADDQAFEDVSAEIPQYDRDRLAFRDQQDDRLGKRRATTIAVTASGDLVGGTELNWFPDATLAEQGTTVVLPEHRGHRIGIGLKVANLRLMTGYSPGLRRVVTWNNHLNEHMIAINTAMGFTPLRPAAMFATPAD